MNRWVGPIVLGVGVVLLVVIVIMGWVVMPNVIDSTIEEEVRLVNGTDTWDKWQDIPVPVYLNFYVFNILNPDEVEKGEKPIFREQGPYSYRESRVKKNISLLENDEVVKYEQVITYFFDPEKSCNSTEHICQESDKVNIVNIAYMSVVMVLYDLSPPLAALIANSVLGSETFVKRNVTVGDLTFTGMDVRLYTQTLGPLLPEEFSGGRFGLYKGQNASADGVYEIYSGTGKTEDFGRVKTWDGQTTLDFPPEGGEGDWENDWEHWWVANSSCAMINGTDGSLFPPFVEKDWIMYVFSTDLCRSLYLTFEKEVEHDGITGYRFVAPKKMLEDPRTNAENRCFCLEDNINDCTKGGVIHIKGCKGGAPIMMSTPHFLDADEEYREAAGLNPVKEIHETVIDVEPNSGLTLQANKRIQVNVESKRLPQIHALSEIKEYMIFPLLWADEAAKLDQENSDDIKSRLLTPLKIVGIVKWAVLGVSLVTVGIGAALWWIQRRRSNATV